MDTQEELKEVRKQELEARQVLADLAKKRRLLMKRLNEAGLSLEKIGEIYGVKRQRVDYIIKNQ